jgi:type IV pilus assembly protein PilY1
MWKITPNSICSGAGGCSAVGTYAEMGQSWSTPAAVSLRTMPAGVPAVIIGGGYDPVEDVTPYVGPDTMGRALFVVNGANGTLVKAFQGTVGGSTMAYAIPSDPAALNMDDNAQGFVNRIYIGDMHAGLWRFDVNDASTANWGGRLIAQLDQGYTRKVFFPPVVVKQYPFLDQRFDAVYVGTGDKEHPLNQLTNDAMFMVKDFYTGFTSSQAAAILPAAMLPDVTNFNVTACGNPLTVSPACLTGAQQTQWLNSYGWIFPLAGTGEKVTSSPEVIGNVLNFGTYSPTASLNACLPPGLGQLYGINALTGGLADTNLDGSVTPSDTRTYGGAGIKGRGFVAPGGIIVLGGQVYRVAVVDGALRTIPAGSLYQTRTYWQKEPEI